MTPTFVNANWAANANRARQSGLTLFEMLVTLALIGLMAAGTAGAILKMSPRMAVNSVSNQLMADLKRARLEMTLIGAPVAVVFTDDGYVIAALGVERNWPSGVSAAIFSPRKNEILFADAVRLNAYAVTISKGGADARIDIAPVTRRITRMRG